MFGTTRLRHGAARTGLRRRLIGTAAVVIMGAATLTGCAAGQISQTADQVPNHDSAHGTIGTIAVANALFGDSDNPTGPVAFKAGSEVPLRFWVTNDSTEADTLTSISTSVGDVTLSGTTTIPAKGALEVGGESDVSAVITSATEDIKYAFPVTVDFYFQNAGKLTLQVPVTIPAERDADRQGTDIYPAEESNIWHESAND